MVAKRHYGALASIRGAIDLVSVLVGAVIIGLVSSIIVAATMVVIPWSQDAAAQSNISSVRVAESAARATNNAYLPYPVLVAESLVQFAKTVTVILDEFASCYVTVSVSKSGAVFYGTSHSAAIAVYAPGSSDTGWCVSDDDLAAAVEDLVNGEPAADWRDLVTPGNGTTIILNVDVWVDSTHEFCLDVTIGTTSATRVAWKVLIDTGRPPFYGRTETLWTSHSIVHTSTWSEITGDGQMGNPWNNTWNPGLMAAGSEYTMSVCESSMLAPPDRPETYTVQVSPSTVAGQWGGRDACLVATITGTGAYPFYSGWSRLFEIQPAIDELQSHGFQPERISWSPNGSVGQSVTPAQYQPGTTAYLVANGRDNAVKGTDISIFTLCVHDD